MLIIGTIWEHFLDSRCRAKCFLCLSTFYIVTATLWRGITILQTKKLRLSKMTRLVQTSNWELFLGPCSMSLAKGSCWPCYWISHPSVCLSPKVLIHHLSVDSKSEGSSSLELRFISDSLLLPSLLPAVPPPSPFWVVSSHWRLWQGFPREQWSQTFRSPKRPDHFLPVGDPDRCTP